jgi:hypothetical protein
MGDCLICLGTTRKIWRPVTPCDCRVNIHRDCWERWVERSGEICIICRAPEPRALPPRQVVFLHHPAPIIFVPPPPFYRCYRGIMRLIEITMFLSIVYIVLLIYVEKPRRYYIPHQHGPMPIPLPLPRPLVPPPRDEL